jgi:hypothetical protein
MKLGEDVNARNKDGETPIFTTDLDKLGAVARLRLLNWGWREILPGDQVRDLATQLLDKHSLRATDSLQLAASLVWCEQRPSEELHLRGPAIGQSRRVSWILSSRTFANCSLNKISRLMFSTASSLPARDGSAMLWSGCVDDNVEWCSSSGDPVRRYACEIVSRIPCSK